MPILSFKPQIVTQNLISGLNERVKDIISQRFGIGGCDKRKTLEAIGQYYDITRERVRQLENFTLNSLRQSDCFLSCRDIFTELNNFISQRGAILSEKEIFDCLAENLSAKNHIYFLLVLGDDFTKIKEDNEFHHRWTTDSQKAEKIHEILTMLHKNISDNDLLSKKEIISLLQNYAKEKLNEKIKEDIILSWLNISKLIGSNVLGEWGSVSSRQIRPKGMRDLVFLVLKKQGSPLHFSQVAKSISDLFSREVHSATTHNELIKDERFVLVGRGIYGLSDWGYSPGIVRDVIKDVLESTGTLSKDEIVECVLKKRFVKKNTILINLQNRNFFERKANGAYKAI
jgi:hypothetical protein